MKSLLITIGLLIPSLSFAAPLRPSEYDARTQIKTHYEQNRAMLEKRVQLAQTSFGDFHETAYKVNMGEIRKFIQAYNCERKGEQCRVGLVLD